MARKVVRNGKVLISEEYVDSLSGTGSEIINKLKEWSRIFEVDLSDFDYFDNGDYAIISSWRPLTEQELEAERVKQEKSRLRSETRKQTLETKERKEYERLKKKYG